MGTSITDWAAVDGAYYAGAGAEMFWFIVVIVLCVLPLIVGSRHELDAYKKLKK